MMDGIINVYKEEGFTSFDVVAKLRGILKQKKIGHTGTLDPAAEGVLPVCLGNGTKLCELLTDKTKEYEAVLLLGQTTDTQDTTGTILSKRPVTCTRQEICDAVMSFCGTYDQVPPMYSALKVDGKRLYELAREGKTVERKSRRIEIFEIRILDITPPRVTFRICCSKGTYIRTLCHDIGGKLGCGGCMERLLRTRSGNYRIEEALTLQRIEELRDRDRLLEAVLPLDSAFDFPRLCVLPDGKKKLDNGNPLKVQLLTALKTEGLPDGSSVGNNKDADSSKQRYWIYEPEGRLAAIYWYDDEKQIFMPDKMFPKENA